VQPEELAKLTMHNHTWYHVSRYAGSFVAHHHRSPPGRRCTVCAPESASRTAPTAAFLRFLDTRPGADSYLDAANRRMRAPYALKPREMRLEEGQVVVFPSYVFHEVTPFYGADTRITVATNCWFV